MWPPREATNSTLLLMMTGWVLFAPMNDCGLTDTLVGVSASVFTLVTRHSPELVNSSRLVSGTRCRIVFASRAATRNTIESSSRVGNEYDRSDSVPDRVIHRFCGLLMVPAKTRRCS